ncbi:hypothetical protein M9H77_17658 [Catharanthus roseus]|uniref:Uncharacterized protein n=1 Tax=Catharanthus roseus TaxID=4058 RepID=A0ACC0B567_CATRO|nr:hypothetical protein M9H77_17658 [Catharanthus roseus]
MTLRSSLREPSKGAVSDDFLCVLVELIWQHKPIILVIVETKTQSDKAIRILRSTHFDSLAVFEARGYSGDMRRLGETVNIPWLIIGDTYQPLSSTDKRGGRDVNWRQSKELWDTIDVCGWHDMGFASPSCTWSNKRSGCAQILERLDRAWCNTGWQIKAPQAMKSTLAECSVRSPSHPWRKVKLLARGAGIPTVKRIDIHLLHRYVLALGALDHYSAKLLRQSQRRNGISLSYKLGIGIYEYASLGFSGREEIPSEQDIYNFAESNQDVKCRRLWKFKGPIKTSLHFWWTKHNALATKSRCSTERSFMRIDVQFVTRKKKQ